MTYEEKLTAALSQYIQTEAAVAVARDLIMFVKTGERVLIGRTDDETKQGMARSLMTFSTGLMSNPFYMNNAGFIQPVFATAVAAWLDSMTYLNQGDSPDARTLFIVTRNIVPQIAVAVLFCDQGQAGVAQHSTALRQELVKIDQESTRGMIQ